MDGFIVLLIVLISIFVGGNVMYRMFTKGKTSSDGPIPISAPGSLVGDLINRLPTIYYFLGIIAGIVLLVATFGSQSDAEKVAMLGYTVGAVLSMFAVGRVIELLQQIRDAVRS